MPGWSGWVVGLATPLAVDGGEAFFELLDSSAEALVVVGEGLDAALPGCQRGLLRCRHRGRHRAAGGAGGADRVSGLLGGVEPLAGYPRLAGDGGGGDRLP